MDKQTKNMVKGLLKITDEDLSKLSPEMEKWLSKGLEIMSYKIIAEITESRYCSLQIKPGDKIVFWGPRLVPEETTCAICMALLGPIYDRARVIFDRIVEGVDPNGSMYKSAECYDVGLEHGGLGKVRFKVYAKRI